MRIRRGLYAVVPPGVAPRDLVIDPYLLAGKITDDAILGYHTALEAHGRAYSVFRHFTYFTRRNLGRGFEFQGITYQGVSFPKVLRDSGQEDMLVGKQDRAGLDIRVTKLERSFVDVLDRPTLSGSWEEIWRSLESIEFLNPDLVLEYLTILGNATTAAKAGFFLEQNQDSLMVDDETLSKIQSLCPTSPHYMDRNFPSEGKLLPRWNLIVPSAVIEREWEEIG